MKYIFVHYFEVILKKRCFFCFRLIPALLMETRAQMAPVALHYNKVGSNANAYQAGKDNFVKSTPTIVLKNLVFLAHLAQI